MVWGFGVCLGFWVRVQFEIKVKRPRLNFEGLGFKGLGAWVEDNVVMIHVSLTLTESELPECQMQLCKHHPTEEPTTLVMTAALQQPVEWVGWGWVGVGVGVGGGGGWGWG